jgi:hypothetical protein
MKQKPVYEKIPIPGLCPEIKKLNGKSSKELINKTKELSGEIAKKTNNKPKT